ncbi:MAG TPA: branched-chain amino acid transaminase [Actinomycetota bacterium]|nr:branched-chain amino acid transaminase [Actinomycetota bacterium]
MPVAKTEKIWMDGALVDWADANIHVLTPSLHYGWGVYEGIRTYESARGPAAFRLTDHMRRLHRSARMLTLDVPYSVEELVAATKDLVRVNDLASCYIRPIVFLRDGEIGLNPLVSESRVAIIAFPLRTSLGDDAIRNGIRAKISSFRLIDSNAIPPQAKATGRYINSSLAKVEAVRAGYDDAILLSPGGYVAEGTTLNFFAVLNDELVTPPASLGALRGITQDSVVRIAADLGWVTREAKLNRADVYVADEAFLTGTAAEVVPIRSIDDHELGGPGVITKKIQETFYSAIKGEIDEYASWLEHVDE